MDPHVARNLRPPEIDTLVELLQSAFPENEKIKKGVIPLLSTKKCRNCGHIYRFAFICIYLYTCILAYLHTYILAYLVIRFRIQNLTKIR